MKYFVLAISFLTLFGCVNDIVDIEQTVTQQHNLEDLDADGVIEARERCADTFLGANIDNYGCSSVKRIDDSITLKINFANNSSAISQADFEKIKEVSDFMRKFPGSHVTIEGHCSRQGSAELNQKLSENRAKCRS
ncbi:MAG: OmpA family protein [Psychrobium sp.]